MIILTENELREAVQLTIDEMCDIVESDRGAAFIESFDDCFPGEFSFFAAIRERVIDKITDQNIRKGEEEKVNNEIEKIITTLRTMRL